jgi:hydroxyethylthiazole kinase-like uncharacterized protein yjeF
MRRKQSSARRLSATPIDAALLGEWPLPAVNGELGKVGRGQVLIIGGSVQNPGAVMLAGVSALRAGAGRLQIATAASVAPLVAVNVPEARVLGLRHGAEGELSASSCRALRVELNAMNALLIGPGMMQARAAAALLTARFVASTDAALIVDAGALAVLGKAERALSSHRGGAILTPHAGEMARMCGIEREAVLRDPLQIAREAAARHGAIVVLKGASTFIASPDGQAFCNRAGGVGLGTSGSGDVLAGLIAGLCARGTEPLQAAVWGVHLHALAGERLARKPGPLGFLARELSSEVPVLLKNLQRPRRFGSARARARDPGTA